MATPNPGTIWQENDPRLERFVKVIACWGDRVRIIRVNEDGSPYPKARETEANLFRFDSYARGKYRFIKEAAPRAE